MSVIVGAAAAAAAASAIVQGVSFDIVSLLLRSATGGPPTPPPTPPARWGAPRGAPHLRRREEEGEGLPSYRLKHEN